jgi:glycosyltransferase involved in cell wall biosynthesis
LFYINRLGFAGAQKVICNLANAFCNSDEVMLVTSYSVPDEFVLDCHIKRVTLEQKKKKNVLLKNIYFINQLRITLKQFKPDVAVSFMAEPNFRLIISSFFLSTKTIVSVRNMPDKEYHGKIRQFLARLLFRFANGHVFQTAEAQAFFPKSIQQHSCIILNSVDKNFYRNPPKQTKDILNYGRLEPAKNQLFLIRAFASIAEEFPDQNLHFFGKGHQQPILENEIKRLQLTNRIFIHSPQKNIVEYIGTFKLFVLSSDYEGMPNALMEAMAMGIPCISTDCPAGGPRVLLKPEQLVPVGNEQALANKIREILLLKNLTPIIQYEKEKANNFDPMIINEIWHKYLYDVATGKK